MQAFSRTRRSGFEKLSLGAVVREVNQLLRVARGRHIALRYDLQDDAPEIFADRALVSQMLVNLVMNACEAIGGQEGTVTIGVRSARLDAETAAGVRPARLLDEGTYAALWIADSGCGIGSRARSTRCSRRRPKSPGLPAAVSRSRTAAASACRPARARHDGDGAFCLRGNHASARRSARVARSDLSAG
jgi:hypothetical protein